MGIGECRVRLSDGDRNWKFSQMLYADDAVLIAERKFYFEKTVPYIRELLRRET